MIPFEIAALFGIVIVLVAVDLADRTGLRIERRKRPRPATPSDLDRATLGRLTSPRFAWSSSAGASPRAA